MFSYIQKFVFFVFVDVFLIVLYKLCCRGLGMLFVKMAFCRYME